jgi:hypothetical protein
MPGAVRRLLLPSTPPKGSALSMRVSHGYGGQRVALLTARFMVFLRLHGEMPPSWPCFTLRCDQFSNSLFHLGLQQKRLTSSGLVLDVSTARCSSVSHCQRSHATSAVQSSSLPTRSLSRLLCTRGIASPQQAKVPAAASRTA